MTVLTISQTFSRLRWYITDSVCLKQKMLSATDPLQQQQQQRRKDKRQNDKETVRFNHSLSFVCSPMMYRPFQPPSLLIDQLSLEFTYLLELYNDWLWFCFQNTSDVPFTIHVQEFLGVHLFQRLYLFL
ncbi:hypothetical protein H105_04084 [Trichophyton soudanense CBS 452.61]|uniref:Uncharacterized protein n=1 Tax=Trichophyton soudanense CBS 452.61 TaxID=1215331 RepID=A0A022XUP6_TRISD|nr:hypothetical protein H105_04084 [Trichophyton soudanense CBS 452.61]EZG06754.1 hypothetical protein H106_03883 [Trichophyton rubrum CBS 735.88]